MAETKAPRKAGKPKKISDSAASQPAAPKPRRIPSARRGLEGAAPARHIAPPEAMPIGMEDVAVTEEDQSMNHAAHAVSATSIHGLSPSAPIPRAYQPPAPTPKPAAPQQSRSAQADFLAPSNNSFDLASGKSRNGFVTFLTWLLSILIILGIIALVMLYRFPNFSAKWVNKIAHEQLLPESAPSNSSSSSSSQTPAAIAPTPTPVVFRAAAPQQLAQAVDAAVQSAYPSLQVSSNTDSSELASQNLTADTLLYKTPQQSQAQQIAATLASSFGLQVQLTADDSLQEDILVYLVPKLSSPNLNGSTALVSNANGVPGAARQYCQVLTGYKAGSCSAVNATSAASGITVSYKKAADFFTLARTPEFASATFQQAPAGQAQDISVTIGK